MPRRLASGLGAHEQHGERVFPCALVDAPAKAPFPSAARVAAKALPLLPALSRERRLGLLPRRAAKLEHAGLPSVGGVATAAGWAAQGHTS